ncbi:MAG: transposase [Rubrivivax sp.]|nr:transposase [Rubrivivax sp.]MBK8528028.1 transposase [Rubrivivax sp.]
MNPNHSNRRVHSSEFKLQVLGECKQPGASVAAVAVARGLNPNVVRKWRAGRNLKRMDAGAPAPAPTAPLLPALQFVPVELAKFELHQPSIPASQPDIRIKPRTRRLAAHVAVRCMRRTSLRVPAPRAG